MTISGFVKETVAFCLLHRTTKAQLWRQTNWKAENAYFSKYSWRVPCSEDIQVLMWQCRQLVTAQATWGLVSLSLFPCLYRGRSATSSDNCRSLMRLQRWRAPRRAVKPREPSVGKEGRREEKIRPVKTGISC